jgi:hypothetical protein
MKTLAKVYLLISFICFSGINTLVFAQNALPPIITKQPVGGTFAKNATLRLYLQAQVLDNGYLTYQWYYSPNSDGSSPTEISGSTGSILQTTTSATAGTYYYWCKVANTTATTETQKAEVIVIDKEYPDHLINGDMENWIYKSKPETGSRAVGLFHNWPNVQVPVVSSVNLNSSFWYMAVGAGYDEATKANGWYTTHQNTLPAWNVNTAQTGGPLEVQIAGAGAAFAGGTAANGNCVIELVFDAASCVYQHVATQPGKIYEWSLLHSARKDNGTLSSNRIAVIMGKNIASASDYADAGNSQWLNEEYPYGVNNIGNSNMTNFFQKIVLKLADEEGYGTAYQNLPVGKYTTTYNNSVYYICIVESTMSAANTRTSTGYWNAFKGEYTVPEGQGTSVFAFACIYPAGGVAGNGLDNVVFASGGSLSTEPSISYSGLTSLNVSTRPGYVYGLVEVRGSTVRLLPDPEVTYCTGTGCTSGSSVPPPASVGSHWYYPNAEGRMFFKDLLPGATYRIVGIPLEAVSEGLGTNLDPGRVLDDGYYTEVTMPSSSLGSEIEMGLVTGSVYLSGSDCKARLSVFNTHEDVEYALLETNGSEAVPWRPGLGIGTNASLLFEELAPGHNYLLVSRPYGYTEINYTSALLSGVQVQTPGCSGVHDILPGQLSLSPAGDVLTLSESDARAYYGIYDPLTGNFLGGMQPGGGPLTFTGLNPGSTYHITLIENIPDAVFSVGVRIYPYTGQLSIDYPDEMVKSTASLGNLPVTMDYRLESSNGFWVLGDDTSWRQGSGVSPLPLGYPASGMNSAVLDSLKTLSALSGTLYYRAHPGLDGWTGPYYSPEQTLEIPRRPAAPVRDTHYAVNYRDEQLESLPTYGILWSGNWGNSWQSPPLTAASPLSFPSLGWVEADHTVSLRFPASATVFASDTTVQLILGRGEEPRGVLAIINTTVTIEHLEETRTYQYSLESPVNWIEHTTGTGETRIENLPYDINYDYLIRYAATDDAPASFYQVLSAPLMVLPVNFGNEMYSVPVAGMEVVIKNMSANQEEILDLKLDGGDAALFTLSPSLGAGNNMVPGAVSLTELGENRLFSVTPEQNLPVGHYQTSIRIEYRRDGLSRWGSANVYLNVIEMDWDDVLTGQITGATTSSLTVSLSDIPSGAGVELRIGDSNYLPVASSNGVAVHTFTGLSPESRYTFYYRIAADGGHNASAEKSLTGWTAYEPVDAVRVNYMTEMLLMRGGYSSSNFDIKVNGTPVTMPYQVSLEAESGFTVSTVRIDPNGIIPSSEPYSFPVTGREDAPGNITLVSSSGESVYDGSITLPGTTAFQYRISGNINIMSGWTDAVGTTGNNLHLDSYEVRYPATGSQFASKYATLNMDNVPSFTITQPAICLGESIVLSSAVSQISPGAIVKFYSNADGTGELTGGALTVSPPATTVYYVQATSGGFSSNMKMLELRVNPIPEFTLSSNAERICVTGPGLDLSALVSGFSNGIVHYYSDAGCTSELVSSTVITGTYYLRAENATTGCRSAVQTVTVSEKTATSITTQPAAATVCSGTPLTLSVTAQGESLTYQWYDKQGDRPITGATGTTYSPTSGGTFYVKVSGECGEVQSADALATIHPLPVPAISPAGTAVYTGETISYTTDSGKDDYNWTASNGLVTGTTSPTASVTWGGSGTGSLSVTYREPGTGCRGTSTLPVSVIIQGDPVISGSTSVCQGVTGELYSTEPGKQSYDWEVTGGTFTGQGNHQISVSWNSTTQSGNKVSVRYKNTAGSPYTGLTEYPVEVKQAPSVATIAISGLYCAGGTLYLGAPTVTTRGSGISSQGWMLEGTPLTMPYTLTAADHNRKLKYFARCDCGLTGYSNEVVLNVGTPPTVGTITAPAALCAGSPLSPAVPAVTANTAAVTAEGWMLDGVKIATPYRPVYADNGKALKYYAETQSCGTGYSGEVNITVYDVPSITGTLSAPAVCAGSRLALTAPAVDYRGNSDQNTAYWTLNDIRVDLSNYTFQSLDNGKILKYCAANSCGSTTTAGVAITVNALPVPTILPNSTSQHIGDNITYSTEAGMSNYYWSVTNASITGSTTPNPAVTWDHAGSAGLTAGYTDRNGCTGSTTLSVAVAVLGEPDLTGSTSVCKGATGEVYSTDPGKDSYEWTVTGGTFTGQGSRQITVTWNSTNRTGNKVSVRYKHTSAGVFTQATEYAVEVKQPAIVENITGLEALYCAGSQLNLSAPVVTEQGSAISAGNRGWELDGTAIPMPYSLSLADNGKTLRYRAVCDCGFTSYSTGLTVNVGTVPAIAGIPIPDPVCAGTAMTLSVPAVTPAGAAAVLEEGWMLDGTKIASNYQTLYSDNNRDLKYYAETQGCGTGYSNTVTVTVHDVPSITGAPSQSPEVCEDGTLVLATPAVNYHGNTDSEEEYWTLDQVRIDLQSYRFQLQDNGKILSYRAGNSCGYTESAGVTVTVHALPVISLNHNKPLDGTCPDTNVTFTTEPGQTGYLWAWTPGGTRNTGGYSTDNTVSLSWNTPGTKTVSVNYTDGNGCSATNPVEKTILINPRPVAGVFPDLTLCSGSNSGAVYPVGGTAVNGYTWTGGVSAGLTDNTATLNLTSIADFTGTAVSGTTTARVRVVPHYVNNTVSCEGTATTFAITVNPVTAITVQPSLSPGVTYPSGYVVPYTTVNLSVTAIGPNLSYSWYKDGAPLAGTGKYSGVTSSKLTITDVYDTEDGDYQVVVSGDCGTVTANTVRLRIMDASLRDLQVNGVTLPDFHPAKTGYLLVVPCTDEQVTLLGIPSSSTVTGLAGNGTYPLVAGDNNFTLTVTASDGTTTMEYQVNVIRDCHVPKITKDLEDAVICRGDSHTFEIGIEGENLTYEWYYGNNRIWGANTNTYTVSNSELRDYEQYYVIVRSVYGEYRYSVYSRLVRLWVAEYLPETLQFADCPAVVTAGETHRVKLAGYPDVTKYGWSYRKTGSYRENDGVIFSPAEGGIGENETWATFGILSKGAGIITATLEHPCGTREAVQTIEVKYPTGTDNVTATSVQVSPNPTSGIVQVFNTKPNQTIRITDVTGSLKGTYPTRQGTTTIDLTGYAKGAYMLQYDGKTVKVLRK